MLLKYELTGVQPGIIMHCAVNGLDPALANAKKSITAKRGTITPEEQEQLKQHDTLYSMWMADRNSGENSAPEIPTRVIRAVIEGAARKTKEGPAVREGLTVSSVAFDWDRSLGETCGELAKNPAIQHSAVVNVQRSRLLRWRARFSQWSAVVEVEIDPEIVSETRLIDWLETGGRRIGIGDWRPEKSGEHGRFTVVQLG